MTARAKTVRIRNDAQRGQSLRVQRIVRRWRSAVPDAEGWWLWRDSDRTERLLIVCGSRHSEVASDDEWENATGEKASHDGFEENYWEGTDTKIMRGYWMKETTAKPKVIERKKRGGSSGAAPGSARCEGWRRTGIFQMGGTGRWKQCEAQGIVTLKFKDPDSGKVRTLPACKECWAECLANGVTIIEARPIAPNYQALPQGGAKKGNDEH